MRPAETASCSVQGCSGRIPAPPHRLRCSRAGLRRLGCSWGWRWLPAGIVQKQIGGEKHGVTYGSHNLLLN